MLNQNRLTTIVAGIVAAIILGLLKSFILGRDLTGKWQLEIHTCIICNPKGLTRVADKEWEAIKGGQVFSV